MKYASAQDLRDRYPEKDLRELTDPTGAAIDDGKLESALKDASAVIDGYLEGRYVLPLARVPAVLTVHACNIAMYNLQGLRPLQDIEDARKRYEDSVRYLTKVAEGKVTLGLTALGEAAPPTAAPELASAPRTFTRDTLRGM